jgi:magnesium chelatase subunit H
MNVAVLYVGSSLLAPLCQAERDLAREYGIELRIAAHNLGPSLAQAAWLRVERDLSVADIVFVIHITDGENAARLARLLDRYRERHRAVVVINCMPELMRRTRMGRLRFGPGAADEEQGGEQRAPNLARRLRGFLGAWMSEQARAHRSQKARSHTQYLRFIERVPSLLRLVPSAGPLRDIKNYLQIFCYFLQPTPANIRAMVLYALKHYAPDARLAGTHIDFPPPETLPAVAIYHPDAPALFTSFADYRAWYERRAMATGGPGLDPERSIGLLLMRPQIVSRARLHYDGLIRAIEAEGLGVVPAISTFMDNRIACQRFFVEEGDQQRNPGAGAAPVRPRVSQVVSLTGFSFVGGPAMNDSEAAVRFLRSLNRPFRSAVSLDMQTIESWDESPVGLNPVQAGMQIAIPEIDGATEPFVYGGLTVTGPEPVPLADRCRRMARRLKRWNRLRTAGRADLKLALVIFCFPPNKGNVGTAAELDVFPSLCATLNRLRDEGYRVELPASADELRERLLGGNAAMFGATANVAYRLNVDEYRRLCPYVDEIEAEWGPAPGAINSFGRDLLVQGLMLGNVFIGVQPTFGYEGDPMRLMMARGSAPHHGFMALYTYLEKIFGADAVIHIGTHGALEFMPGKQVGLSGRCWPDRLVGELPHIYIYSVNNPSEGSIAKRRSYAELISYLTPPVADAGLYRELAALKEALLAYRQATDERERERLYATIEELARTLRFGQ